MHLTLEEASERAKIPREELLRCIENDELIANRKTDSALYHISEKDLEAFLNKRSFDNFWNNNDEAENAPVEKQTFAQSGNLRRVLTAEVVAELKIEHQVLISRVETLERLFSEFMEMEKTEKTLVLEDSWKIEPPMVQEKSGPNASDGALSIERKEDDVVLANASLSKDRHDTFAAEAGKEEKVLNAGQAVNTDVSETHLEEEISSPKFEAEKTANDETSQHTSRKDEPKTGLIEAKQKSAKDSLVKKLKYASKDLRDAEEGRAKEPAEERPLAAIEEDSSIAAKLAKYERRLAEAKQTATQIWH